ncbi:MAG: hypothetical protein AAB839_03405 [Patescibacteria group bacterium]
MRKHSRLFSLAITSLIGVLFPPIFSFAATTPSSADIFVLPGESATVTVPVQNTMPYTTDVALIVLSVHFTDESDSPQFEKLSDEQRSRIQIEPAAFELVTGEVREVAVTVIAPIDAETGVETFALAATEAIPGSITLSHGAATLLFVTTGYPPQKGECISFIKNSDDAIQLTTVNRGSGILVHDGVVRLRGLFGVVLGASSSNSTGHRVLPNQTREWSVSLPMAPWWAIGPMFYVLEDDSIETSACSPIAAGTGWWPLVLVGIIGAGGVAMLARRR